jgi:hypothetical protein
MAFACSPALLYLALQSDISVYSFLVLHLEHELLVQQISTQHQGPALSISYQPYPLPADLSLPVVKPKWVSHG